MDSGLKGMRALITGGPTGIGFGIVEGLAREGTNLVLASRRPGDEAVRRLRLLGVGCEWVQADVSSEDGVIRMVDEAWHVFDGIELDVNNAAGTWHEAITKLTSDSWRKRRRQTCRRVRTHAGRSAGGSSAKVTARCLSSGRRPPTSPFTVNRLTGYRRQA